jgi:hypothetical protein
MTNLSSNLAVVRNAFSTATGGAKVPDGRVSSSIGRRCATQKIITSSGGYIMLALIPGFGTAYQLTKSVKQPTGTDVDELSDVQFNERDFLPTVVFKEKLAPTTPADRHRRVVGTGPASSIDQDDITSDKNIAPPPDDGGFNDDTLPDTAPTFSAPIQCRINTPNAPNKWRLVSAGLRVSVLNNLDNISGIFEVVLR